MTTSNPTSRRLLGLAALAATLLAAAPAQARQDDFVWRGRLDTGRTIEIKGVLGDIEAVAAAGDEVEVTATKSARRSDPDDVTFELVEHAGGVTICAVYPTPRSDRPNECRPGSGGRMNTRDNDVVVHFIVRVPRGVRFVGRTVNGEIEALSLQSDVEAYSVNGGVHVSTTGLAAARTVNGSITATLGRADWADALEFETVNGGVTIELPSSISADVRIKTVNGGITTDFPLQVQGRFNSREIRGTIGGGGRSLEITTVNGSVRLRKIS